LFRRLWEKLKLLWKLAKSERATPREIGWAVGIGAFAGCTPAIGVHGPLAMGLATLARKNRLFAWLGSRISNMIMLPFIALAEVQVAHRLRTGAFLDLTRDNALEQAPNLLLDWCLGMFPVGGAIGVVMGFAAYAVAHRRDVRKARAAAKAEADAVEADAAAETRSEAEAPTPPKPAALPPPSSGSPA
jgi:uncharacterized protein (DUF2062 family)